MNTREAFLTFTSKLLEEGSGIFFSHQPLEGDQRWVFGVGEGQEADFSKGPFPFFSLTSFLGDEVKLVHFTDWKSSEKADESTSRRAYEQEKELENREQFLELEQDLSAYSSETKDSFIQKIKDVQEASKRGEIWVLNLAHELSSDIRYQTSDIKKENIKLACSLFYNFLKLEKYHCGGAWCVDDQLFCSISPETFLIQQGQQLHTYPIKGTGTREYLETSAKEKSELDMITDLLRNDLGQIADKVEVPRERVLSDLGHFYHAHAEIIATLSTSTLSWEQFQKLLPCGSITGAPKARVLQYIEKLESFDRGYYTGTFGVKFSPSEGIWNILIRTLFLEKTHWKFPVGAGITYCSDPEYEWEETLEKGKQLRG